MAICHKLAALLLCSSLGTAALAGTPCADTAPKPASIQQAFAAAYKTHQRLETLQPQLALLARVGQDLSKYGLRYSHMAFVSKDAASGQWRVTHLLNGCNSNQSALWHEGLANFFLDDLFAYEALLIIPSPGLQQKLLPLVGNDQAIMAMHQPLYNMLAYPFALKYQNSNQWVLELLTEGLAQQAGITPAISTRKQAQQWLQLTGYQPSTLKLSPLTRLGARMFRANVAFDDHPDERRYTDQIDTVTVESMAAYLKRVDPTGSSEVLP